jgi:hypothetical protein
MANYTLTTSPQEVGSNLSADVGARLLAWYTDASTTNATVHLKLQAISQGATYTGTNKDYELTLDSTATGTVAWPYAPLPEGSWVDVAEITQLVGSGSTVNVSGKVWTYVYGDTWVAGNTVTMPVLSSPPTGLAVTINEVYTDGAKFNVSISSYGNPSSASGRWIEAGIAGQNAWESPSLRSAIVENSTSAQITVNNNSTQTATLTVQPNTQYYYGGYASNTAAHTSLIAGTFVTKAEAPTLTLGTISETNAVINYATTADGGVYAKTIEYSIDGGTTWVTGATVNTSSASTGSFTISGLTGGTSYTLKYRTSTTAGNTAGSDITFSTLEVYKLYGSVNSVTKKIKKLYGSVNNQSKEIKKLYGSVNGVTKRIF